MLPKKGFLSTILSTTSNNGTIIIRLVVGLIFLSEGVLKYIHPEWAGTARFEKIGFADPAFWSYFVGAFEIVCGTFILLGFLVRIASVPLLVIMLTAFITTKWPILLNAGFARMAHEYRTDFAMTLLLVYLLIFGSGRWSLDKIIIK
jgi:putative oxidoreductase